VKPFREKTVVVRMCRKDGCDRPEFSRGQCKSHLTQTRRAIENGWITERELMAAGYLLPPKQPFKQWIMTAKREARTA
jgi:hypothetical protein